MKNFSSFLTEAADLPQEPQQPKPTGPKKVSDTMVASFGRYNPMHKGHERALKYAKDLAKERGADARFYASKSQDDKKNPIDYKTKMADNKKQFPDYADDWDDDDEVRTILDVAKKAGRDGYKNFNFVGGEDRREAMENLLRKYNGNLYDFDNIYGHSAGEREGEDDIENMSASKLRNFAMNDDFEGFAGGMPKIKGFDPAELFREVQQYGMKNEEFSPEKLHQLYADGMLYKVGDVVESLTTSMRGRIHRCGANHLIVVTEDNIMFKSFIHDVQAI